MKVKRVRLRPQIKKILTIEVVSIYVITILSLFNIGINRINDMFDRCDKATGQICDYYTARNHR